MEWFTMITSGILFIAGLLVAIKNIADIAGKPIIRRADSAFKRRTMLVSEEQEFKDRIVEIMNEVLPDILYQHDLQTRDTYKADRQRYLQEIKQEVVTQIESQLQQVNVLTKQYEALAISAKDVLREKIVCMYEQNKEKKSLRFFEKEALTQYYKDYKTMGGNSYIERIYGRMVTWTVEEDDYQ